jgi:hypothetical protein
MTSHDDVPTSLDRPSFRRQHRFSEGMEHMPLAPSSSRLGRFSDGLARSPRGASANHIGSFAGDCAQAGRALGSPCRQLQRRARATRRRPENRAARLAAEHRSGADRGVAPRCRASTDPTQPGQPRACQRSATSLLRTDRSRPPPGGSAPWNRRPGDGGVRCSSATTARPTAQEPTRSAAAASLTVSVDRIFVSMQSSSSR